MTKTEAIDYMVAQIEAIEKDRLAAVYNIDPNQQKSVPVEKIFNVLKELEISDEDQ